MQSLRDFWRFHFFKALIILVIIQLAVIAWLQIRNHKPEAIPDDVSVYEGHTLKIRPLRNDLDKDEDDLDSLMILSFTESSVAEIRQEGRDLIYTTSYGFSGTDSITYIITDGKGKSNEATIHITIDKNQPPAVTNQVLQQYAGNPIRIPVLQNANDRENDSVYLQEFSEPLYGKLTIKDNEIIYTSTSHKAVTDSFHYVISDGYSSSDKASVVIHIRDKKHALYPWLAGDIGEVAKPGHVTYVNGNVKLSASGRDIWNVEDQFHFYYQEHNGNCEIIAKVESIEAGHDWAKAGIMIRENLSAGSKNVFMALSNRNGITNQCRTDRNVSTSRVGENREISGPYWLKLNREGNSFTASGSTDGKSWESIGSCEVDMNENTYLGLAFCSHDNEELANVVFSNISIK